MFTINKSIKIKYILALFLIGLISVCFAIFISNTISKNKQYGLIINIAGKQRMLSQRSTLLGLQLISQKKTNMTIELESIFEEMKKSQEVFKCDGRIKCHSDLNEQTLKLLLNHNKIITESVTNKDSIRLNEYINSDLTDFLNLLDERTKKIELESDSALDEIISFEILIMITLLLTLLFEYIYIFRPIFKSLFQSIDQLGKKNSTINELLKEKNQILNDIAHNFRTPLNYLYEIIRNEKEVEKESLSEIVKKIDKTIDFVIMYHNQEIEPRKYMQLNRIYKRLINDEQNNFSILNPSSFYLLQERRMSSFISSANVVAKSLNLDLLIEVGDYLIFTFAGEIKNTSSVEVMLKEEKIFPDVIQATFFKDVKESLQSVFKEDACIVIKCKIEKITAPKNEQEIKKILIVDDNKINIKVLKNILSKKDYEIQECYNGIECIEILKKFEPDIIFMDTQMPFLDGNQAISRIRIHNKKVHIITLSANNFSTDISKAMMSGSNSFISKPIRSFEVEDEIRFAENYYGMNKIIFEKN